VPAPKANLIPDGAAAGFEGFYRPGGAPLDYAYYRTAYLIPANTDVISASLDSDRQKRSPMSRRSIRDRKEETSTAADHEIVIAPG